MFSEKTYNSTNYLVFVFDSSTNFSIVLQNVSELDLSYVVCGGGGAGGISEAKWAAAHGGNGGEVVIDSVTFTEDEEIVITIGAGGNRDLNIADDGEKTDISSITTSFFRDASGGSANGGSGSIYVSSGHKGGNGGDGGTGYAGGNGLTKNNGGVGGDGGDGVSYFDISMSTGGGGGGTNNTSGGQDTGGQSGKINDSTFKNSGTDFQSETGTYGAWGNTADSGYGHGGGGGGAKRYNNSSNRPGGKGTGGVVIFAFNLTTTNLTSYDIVDNTITFKNDTTATIDSISLSWGGTLSLANATSDGTITVSSSSIESGQPMTVKIINQTSSSIEKTYTNGTIGSALTIPSVDLQALTSGQTYNVDVSAQDIAGNTGNSTITFNVKFWGGVFKNDVDISGKLCVSDSIIIKNNLICNGNANIHGMNIPDHQSQTNKILKVDSTGNTLNWEVRDFYTRSTTSPEDNYTGTGTNTFYSSILNLNLN